jgi:hypothetical protein
MPVLTRKRGDGLDRVDTVTLTLSCTFNYRRRLRVDQSRENRLGQVLRLAAPVVVVLAVISAVIAGPGSANAVPVPDAAVSAAQPVVPIGGGGGNTGNKVEE